MPELTVHITKGQRAFLDRKKSELRRQSAARGHKDLIDDDHVMQALLELWMAMDAGKDLKLDDETAHK